MPAMTDDRAHKVMTPEEYQSTPIKGWHMVCRDYDTNYGIGVRYITDGLLPDSPALPARTLSEAVDRARKGQWVEDCAETFANELGRQVAIRVTGQGWNVRVEIVGPDSTFECVVTPSEAISLQRMLTAALASKLPRRVGPDRIEAAARVLFEKDRDAPSLLTFEYAEESLREYYRDLALGALSA
jgi:hypothetical protein